VGVGAVEQALAGHTGEQPAQLGDLGDVGLPIEGRLVGIQAQRQPGGGDLQARTLDARRVVALDLCVVVGEEIEGISLRVAAGDNRRADGPGIVAQVGRAGGGDAGKNTGGHGQSLVEYRNDHRRGRRSVFSSTSRPWKKWPHSATFSSSWARGKASHQAYTCAGSMTSSCSG